MKGLEELDRDCKKLEKMVKALSKKVDKTYNLIKKLKRKDI